MRPTARPARLPPAIPYWLSAAAPVHRSVVSIHAVPAQATRTIACAGLGPGS